MGVFCQAWQQIPGTPYGQGTPHGTPSPVDQGGLVYLGTCGVMGVGGNARYALKLKEELAGTPAGIASHATRRQEEEADEKKPAP